MKSICLTIVDDETDHFILTANRPARVEVRVLKGRLMAEVYDLTSKTPNEPIGAFDGLMNIPNQDWSA